jgi:hypothetical protein
MLSKDALEVYLNDHLAGAVAACDLIEEARDHNQGTPLAEFFDWLLHEVSADRDALERLMDRLDVEKSNVKRAGTWLMEKVSRVKFATSGRNSAHLRNLLELEALRLGVQGKQALWLALQQVKDLDSRLQDADLDALGERAEQQVEAIEQRRLDAGRSALAEDQ